MSHEVSYSDCVSQASMGGVAMRTTNFASSFSAQCSSSAGNASAGLSSLELKGNTGELSHLSPSRTSGSDIGRDGSAGGAALFETVCTSIQNLVGCCACILSIDDVRAREFRVSYIQGISEDSAEKILKKCQSVAVPVQNSFPNSGETRSPNAKHHARCYVQRQTVDR